MAKQSFSQDFEKVVLASLIQDQKFMKEALSVLRQEYFINLTNRSAAAVIIATYVRTKGPPSKVGMLSDLVREETGRYRASKKDEEKLVVEPCRQFVEFLFTPTGKVDDVKSQFLEFCRQREFENVLNEALVKVESGEIDQPTAMELIRKTDKRINATSQGGVDFFLDLPDLPIRMTQMKQRVFTTGFPTLDRRMGGGMGPGTETTFIAPPKGGKSMILVNIAHANMQKPLTIVYFTLEISQEKIQRRFASRISGVPLDELHKNSHRVLKSCSEFWERHQSKLYVKDYPPGTVGCDAFRSYLYWLESDRGVKPDLILIDYGDLVKPSGRHNETRHALAEAWTEMRALAQEFNAGLATASQCNREATSKMIIKMSDIAEAFAKCAISDHIISICKTDEEEQKNRGRLYFAGSREAEAGGQIPIGYDWKTCAMFEINEKLPDVDQFN